jgi:hypothetical protein
MRRGFLNEPNTTSAPSVKATASRPANAPNPLANTIGHDADASTKSNIPVPVTDVKIGASILEREYTFHIISSSNFRVSAILHNSVKTLLPKPFAPPPSTQPDKFEIRLAGNKGAGMFATRDISDGEVILFEHPIMILSSLLSVKSGTSSEQVFEMLYNQLLPAAQQEFLALSNCHPSTLRKTAGIFMTNGIGCALQIPTGANPDLARYTGLFPKASRCNHR